MQIVVGKIEQYLRRGVTICILISGCEDKYKSLILTCVNIPTSNGLPIYFDKRNVTVGSDLANQRSCHDE